MQDKPSQFVHWFRAVSPYIHAHRGQTFVIGFNGEAVMDKDFPSFIHDIALLSSLGIRLVLVVGIRPQIEQRLYQSAIYEVLTIDLSALRPQRST